MGWDAGFLLYIQEYIRSDFLNPIMKVLTHSGDKGILLIVLILALLFIPRTRAIGIMSTISIAIEALLNNVLLKNLIARTRPYDEIEGLVNLVGKQSDYSFPSGHTATAFMGAELVRLEYGIWWGLAAYSVAGATAFLRVWNNWHWTSDVIAGAGIGILSANAAYWLLPLERKLFRMDSKLAGATHYQWQALPYAASTPVGASYGLTLAVQW